MEFSENLIEDDDFRKKVAECKADMENGTDIAEALVKAGIFTGVYAVSYTHLDVYKRQSSLFA